MTFLTVLTSLVAGSRNVSAAQERASERMYAGLERRVSDASGVLPEECSSLPSKCSSPVSSIASLPGPMSPRRPRRLRPDLLRSFSDLAAKPVSTPKPPITLTGIPDITAMDLTPDQLKRNYSSSDLKSNDQQHWDPRKYPMPPLCPMTGQFRYRSAVAADPQWRHDFVRRRIDSLDCLSDMVKNLDMTGMTGLSDEDMRRINDDRARRYSAIRTANAPPDSSADLQEVLLDKKTGTKVLRGFSPPRPSSSRSSFTSRKGSTLSIVTTASDEGSLISPMTSNESPERRGSNQLPTINEIHSFSTADFIKKTERPCDFSDSGDPDSAVASDCEDEDDSWADVVSRNTSVSGITQLLQGRKRQDLPIMTRVRTTSSEKETRGSNKSLKSLDRSRTIRATRGVAQRRISRVKSTLELIKAGDIIPPPSLRKPSANSNEDSDAELTMKVKPIGRSKMEKPVIQAAFVMDNPFAQDSNTKRTAKGRDRSSTIIKAVEISPTTVA